MPCSATISQSSLDVTGRCVLSLRALGAKDIKGPLGAFQLRDEVMVSFHLVFG